MRLLASDPPAPPDALRAAAERASWTLPTRVAALIVEGVAAERIASRLGPGTVAAALEAAEGADGAARARQVLAFIPDPDAPGRRALLAKAVGRATARSARPSRSPRARAAPTARAARSSSSTPARSRGDGLIVADEQAAALLLHADPQLAAELAAARLAPLHELRPAARERLVATLREWLDHQGRVDDTAQALGVHPQTVRYRLAQLRETFGDALDDPNVRFELELALRVCCGA